MHGWLKKGTIQMTVAHVKRGSTTTSATCSKPTDFKRLLSTLNTDECDFVYATPRVLGLLWRCGPWELENKTTAACSVWDTLWTMTLTAVFLQILSMGTKLLRFDL
ncbi:hypothetical protein K443DRAFT_597035 [Laccaria amethystina LaAM-08-1]|uniref:Uncharacterized protein n=1 Tax=Laccaria amethystina LaAM-08-1 TaxID=1095629 RepID=A0A0C9WWZ8_9AGAR|nr:hypothetical protein K443DRAFT_598941 [Laccaria amethystina LaAM-08-1]KIJ89895.1 hypothetical protein K443DRAFT_597035 [Laccaria amethystina LaAM-08-1]